MKILNSYWFSPMGQPVIGIVKVVTDYGAIEHYIGAATGQHKEEDEQLIMKTGARFPDGCAQSLFG
jgi:hypothetical protein